MFGFTFEAEEDERYDESDGWDKEAVGKFQVMPEKNFI